MTIEDPIEFLHRHKRCIVNQSEIGPDATSFAEALRGALRQDPDVILLGEMRDLETITTALTAAETGHLVFATLHTQDAPSTVDRLIDVFPGRTAGAGARSDRGHAPGRRHADAATTRGRLAVASPRWRSSFRTTRSGTSSARERSSRSTRSCRPARKRGMQTLEQALADFVVRGLVTEEIALNRSSRPEQLSGLLKRGGARPDPSGRPSGRGRSRGQPWARRTSA